MNNEKLEQLVLPQTGSSVAEIVVLYEDFSTALHAKRLFDQVLHPLSSSARFRLNMWKFNLLRVPSLRLEAVRDAIVAAIVCIAARANADLPREVGRWAAEWLPQKKGQSAALVLLLEGADTLEAAALPSVQLLKNSANRMQVDFFLHCTPAQHEDNELIALRLPTGFREKEALRASSLSRP